jgi:oxaloacetate decarboxylase gamma subunit
MGNTVINEGLTLMLVGMGTVFAFLTVLVGAMSLMSRLAMRFQPDALPPGDADEEIAAITAAIAAHRRKR